MITPACVARTVSVGEIRRYVLENDLLEAIVGLPTDMFYNTGIATYVWIVSNRKPPARKGKVQLIDASSFWQKMKKSLGSKRRELVKSELVILLKPTVVEKDTWQKELQRSSELLDKWYPPKG